jgi:hypothetical protein
MELCYLDIDVSNKITTDAYKSCLMDGENGLHGRWILHMDTLCSCRMQIDLMLEILFRTYDVPSSVTNSSALLLQTVGCYMKFPLPTPNPGDLSGHEVIVCLITLFPFIDSAYTLLK